MGHRGPQPSSSRSGSPSCRAFADSGSIAAQGRRRSPFLVRPPPMLMMAFFFKRCPPSSASRLQPVATSLFSFSRLSLVYHANCVDQQSLSFSLHPSVFLVLCLHLPLVQQCRVIAVHLRSLADLSISPHCPGCYSHFHSLCDQILDIQQRFQKESQR